MYSFNIDTNEVIRNSDNVVVAPCQSVTEQNYIDYISWVNAGNEPSIISSPTRIVYTVTPVQIRLALNATGLRTELETFLNSDQNYKDIFEFATEIKSDNALVDLIKQSLNKSDAEIDALFALASSITY